MYATIRDELIAEGMLKGEAKGMAKGLAEGMAKGMAEGMARGMAEGIATMLEQLLDSRELVLTEELRERVAGCMDESLLRLWFQRAITAANVTDVFDD